MSLLWKVAVDEATEYFHGTHRKFQPGDVISPANEHGRGVTFASETSPDHAYASAKEDDAWGYASQAFDTHYSYHHRGRMLPRVYRVRPLGPTEKDPEWGPHGLRGVNSGDVRSLHGFEVLHEMPMPEHMGEPEDWR